MKGTLIVIALIIAGLAAVYYGDVGSFDPQKQGEEALTKIKMGMTWKQVEGVAGTPGDFCTLINTGKEDVVILKLGPENKYNPQTIATRISEGSYEYGFAFVYRWTANLQRILYFDETGTLTHMETPVTMSTLLDQ